MKLPTVIMNFSISPFNSVSSSVKYMYIWDNAFLDMTVNFKCQLGLAMGSNCLVNHTNLDVAIKVFCRWD